MSCSFDISDLDGLVQKFLSVLHTRLDIKKDNLTTLWKETKSSILHSNISDKKGEKSLQVKAEKETRICQMMLKKKGQKCEKKVSKNSKTGKYCSLHCKAEDSGSAENAPDLSNYHVFKKNVFDRYVYGDTGLILKNKDEQKIVGHQGANGVIRDLNADEISLCQRRRLDYIANYHVNLAENCEISKVNTVEHTSKLNFI